MLLSFKDDFVLEIPLQNGEMDIIKGTVRELNANEQKEFEEEANNFTKKIEKYQKLKINNDTENDEFKELEHYIKNQNFIMETLRKKFDLTVFSEDKDKLKNICELYGQEGYKRVFETISKSVEEIKEKK